MIDITTETLICIADAAAMIPSCRQGKKTHTATIWRWISKGQNGVRLESIKRPGGTLTSREAVQRFLNALSDPRDLSPRHRPDRKPSKREREAMERECRKRGL